ncbi:hypothetical protein OG21DRAFT_1527175 [Imleria badia]|nr:hypothetical protein OG21DRAFT_1527175 [Imleria badia]
MLSVLGTGVFNSDAYMWKFHRSITRPFFTHDRISHINIFDRHAEYTITQIKSRLRAGYPVDFQVYQCRLFPCPRDEIKIFRMPFHVSPLIRQPSFSLGNVYSLSAGLVYPCNATPVEDSLSNSNDADDFARAFAKAQYMASVRVRRSWLWPLFELWGDETVEPIKIVNAYVEPILKDAIEKAKAASLHEEKNPESSDETTLLNHLVRLTTDPVVLKDAILNIMIAGRDTIAGTLTFVVYLLSTHPNVVARLREEIMTKIGPRSRPTYEAIRDMKYLRVVINDHSMFDKKVRASKQPLYPPPDPSEKPYYVPANTQITYSVLIMHRRKDLWGPDADEFDPDRFLDVHRLHTYLIPQPTIFLPFNAGPRICLGQQFAYSEMSFMLIRLLQHFDTIRLAPDAHAPDTLPPPTWATSTDRKGREKIFPSLHLTMYLHVGGQGKMSSDILSPVVWVGNSPLFSAFPFPHILSEPPPPHMSERGHKRKRSLQLSKTMMALTRNCLEAVLEVLDANEIEETEEELETTPHRVLAEIPKAAKKRRLTFSTVSREDLEKVGVTEKRLTFLPAKVTELTNGLPTSAAEIVDLCARIKWIYACVNMDHGSHMILEAILLALAGISSTQKRGIAIIPEMTIAEGDGVHIAHSVSGCELWLGGKVDYMVIEYEHIHKGHVVGSGGSREHTFDLSRGPMFLIEAKYESFEQTILDFIPQAVSCAVALLRLSNLPELENEILTYYESPARCLSKDALENSDMPLREIVQLLHEWLSPTRTDLLIFSAHPAFLSFVWERNSLESDAVVLSRDLDAPRYYLPTADSDTGMLKVDLSCTIRTNDDLRLFPLVASRQRPDSDAVIRSVPSGETSTARTGALPSQTTGCPLNSVSFLWLFAFHTVTMPSLVPPTIHCPSRDTAMLITVLPTFIQVSVPTSTPFSTRQRRIFPSSPLLTTCFPSTRNVTEHQWQEGRYAINVAWFTRASLLLNQFTPTITSCPLSPKFTLDPL